MFDIEAIILPHVSSKVKTSTHQSWVMHVEPREGMKTMKRDPDTGASHTYLITSCIYDIDDNVFEIEVEPLEG